MVGELCAPEPMQLVELPTGPMQDVAVELMGPVPTVCWFLWTTTVVSMRSVYYGR